MVTQLFSRFKFEFVNIVNEIFCIIHSIYYPLEDNKLYVKFQDNSVST